jgi:hypothetical protein
MFISIWSTFFHLCFVPMRRARDFALHYSSKRILNNSNNNNNNNNNNNIHTYIAAESVINIIELEWPQLPNSSRKQRRCENRITYIRVCNDCAALVMNYDILNVFWNGLYLLQVLVWRKNENNYARIQPCSPIYIRPTDIKLPYYTKTFRSCLTYSTYKRAR